jgi:hypothetical protein
MGVAAGSGRDLRRERLDGMTLLDKFKWIDRSGLQAGTEAK